MVLSEDKLSLSAKLEGQLQKCLGLEDLILSGIEQKERELGEAADREKALEIRAMELESEVQTAGEQMGLLVEKSSILRQELKGREELILMLQEGLTTQIERTELLNNKLITYFEKDERMKDLASILEDEQRRITELMMEQQSSEGRNNLRMGQKQEAIADLVKQLEDMSALCQQLQITLGENSQEIETLHLELESRNKQLQELKQANEENVATGEELEIRVLELQQAKAALLRGTEDQQKRYSAEAERLDKDISGLSGSIEELEGRVAELTARIEEKDNVILEESERLSEKQDELTKQDEVVAELAGKIG